MTPVRSNAWLPVAGYTAVAAVNQMLWLTYTPFTTDAAHHYGVSVGALGWLAQIFPLVYIVTALPAGRLLESRLRLGVGTGAALTALGGLLRVGGAGYWVVLAGQLLVALGQPLVLNAVTKLCHTYLAPDRRATGIAVASAGIFAGMVLALGLGAGFGVGHLGLLLWLQALLSVGAAALLLVGLRTTPTHRPEPAPDAGLRAVLADPRMRLLVVLVCSGFGVFVALTTWLQALLDPSGVSETGAGVMLLVLVLVGVGCSAVLPPRLAARGTQPGFVLGALVAAAAVCLLLAAAPGLVTGTVAAVVVGATLLPNLPVILELAEAWRPGAEATSATLVWLAGNAAGLVVAVLVQLLVHHPLPAFLLLAVVCLAALPAGVRLRRVPMPERPTQPTVGVTAS